MAPKARIVRTLPQPLQEQNGIFGFRIPKLNSIDHEEVAGYYDDIFEVLHHVHSASVVHYDLSWTNIMLVRVFDLFVLILVLDQARQSEVLTAPRIIT